MKRFLMLVGVAVVAAAMYVAAAPGSQQAKGPTARQFNALKRQVASLSKNVTALKKVNKAEATLLTDCIKVAVPINQFGDPDGSLSGTAQGYHYGKSDPTVNTGDVYTTALDVTDPTDTGAVWFVGGDASCGTALGESSLERAAAEAGIRLSHGSMHRPLFVAHGR